MTRGSGTFSARWSRSVLERLSRRSDAAGATRSRLAERYVDEGIRMDEHPGIVFRGGPSGRRAALIGGPDVWEVIAFAKGLDERGEDAISKTAKMLSLSQTQVRSAIRYYSEFGDEVDERVQRNVDEAEAAEAAWQREQAALA